MLFPVHLCLIIGFCNLFGVLADPLITDTQKPEISLKDYSQLLKILDQIKEAGNMLNNETYLTTEPETSLRSTIVNMNSDNSALASTKIRTVIPFNSTLSFKKIIHSILASQDSAIIKAKSYSINAYNSIRSEILGSNIYKQQYNIPKKQNFLSSIKTPACCNPSRSISGTIHNGSHSIDQSNHSILELLTSGDNAVFRYNDSKNSANYHKIKNYIKDIHNFEKANSHQTKNSLMNNDPQSKSEAIKRSNIANAVTSMGNPTLAFVVFTGMSLLMF